MPEPKRSSSPPATVLPMHEQYAGELVRAALSR